MYFCLCGKSKTAHSDIFTIGGKRQASHLYGFVRIESPRVILSGVPPRSHSALPRAFGALLQKFDYAQDDRRDEVEPVGRCVASGSTRDSKILLIDPASRPPYGRVRLRKRHTVTFSPLRMTYKILNQRTM